MIKFTKDFNFVVLIGFLLFTAISFCLIVGKNSIASLLILLCYLWVFYFSLKTFHDVNIPSSEKIIIIVLAFLSFFNVFVNCLISAGNFDFNYCKKIIMFIGALMWIEYCRHTSITLKMYYVILVLIGSVSVIAFLNFPNGFGYEGSSFFLKYSFPNTNQTGLFLSTCAIILFSPICILKKRPYFTMVLIMLAIVTSYLVYLTGCRSALLAIIFTIVSFLLDVLFNIIYLKKSIKIVFCILPLLFLFLFISYIDNVHLDLSFGYLEQGKSNDTRTESWIYILKEFKGNELFGNYYNASHGTGEFQLLNTHLDVLVSYGVVPFLLFVYFLYVILRGYNIRRLSFLQKYGIYAYLSCFITGCFEAALVAGSAGMFIASAGTLLLSNVKERTEYTYSRA